MHKRPITVILLVVIGAVGVFAGLPFYKAWASTFETEGTITALDPTSRRASFEYENPRTGKHIESTTTIPPECPITVNGKTATLEDLRVGEKATVKASWNKKKKELRPLSVRVTRSSESQPHPASAPTPGMS